jgi:hypothetical protein
MCEFLDQAEKAIREYLSGRVEGNCLGWEIRVK